ncbi:MAG: ComEC family competence protein [Prolixibacteraceae bacterium]|jgi:competence protein ComEC|nr:ComEC family competence protein [Prolixibacteraceae bacterium]
MTVSGLQVASAPFVRLLLPLCMGVSLGHIGVHFNAPICAVLLFLAILALLLLKGIAFGMQHIWAIILFIALLFIGILRSLEKEINFPPLKNQHLFVVLDTYPIEKAKTCQVVCQMINSELKILVYLPKSPAVKSAKPGDVLGLEGLPELVENDGNPYEFNYRGYLNNRGIGHRVFLREGQYKFLKGCSLMNISRHALVLREKLIEILYSSGIQKEHVALISSISFGARDEVDKETVQSFTNTGVIHVLAVSGMNVGLIFIILDLFLRFLKRWKLGFLFHTLAVLTGIWGYALVTGMSASILRASVMFTFVVIGNAFRRNANIFNSLAVSAFLLIFWDPAILRDVGFQLSYAAVISIVVIQPLLYKRFYVKNPFLDKIWLLLSVTFAAQIGTLPFTLHYFHQFPVYFWLTNLAVIPLVTFILYLSFVVVFFAPVSGFLTSIFALSLDWSVRLVLLSVNFVESLPHAVLKGIYPSYIRICILLLIGWWLYNYYKSHQFRNLRNVGLLMIVLSIIEILNTYRHLTHSEIIFLNIPGTRAMVITGEGRAVVLYDRCENADEKIGYVLKPYLGERGVNEAMMFQLSDQLRFADRNFSVERNRVYYKGVTIFIPSLEPAALKKMDKVLLADLVWIGQVNSGTDKCMDLPSCRIILYRAPEEVEKEVKLHCPTKSFNVNSAVQVVIRFSPFEHKNRFICQYFNGRNE